MEPFSFSELFVSDYFSAKMTFMPNLRNYSVKFYEVFEEERQAIEQYLPASFSVVFTQHTIQESGDAACPAPIISIRTQSEIPSDWAPFLQGILTRSQGFEHLFKYREKTNGHFVCGYLENYCSRAVAEQAIWMMMSLLRKTKQQMNQFFNFSRDGLTGKECLGKKALVVGVGRIGGEMEGLLKAMGLAVRGVDPAPKKEGVEYVTLQEGLAWADVVFSCVPLTNETRGMLNYDALCVHPVFVINVSRGEVSPLADMQKLLEEGRLLGLAMDVFEEETVLGDALRRKQDGDEDNVNAAIELARRDNVIFTPHNAFNTEEAVERKAKMAVDSLVDFVEKGRFLWIV